MKKSDILAIITLSTILAMSCQQEMPTKEMVKAKAAITRAHQVKADKYDPETLKKAEDRLYNCHSMLQKDDNTKALSDAKESYTLARAAIEKSLPLLARDTLQEALDLSEKGKTLGADIFAPQEYTRGNDLIKESQNLSDQKKYWESYLNSTEAIAVLQGAVAVAEKKITDLESEIARLREVHNRLSSIDTAGKAQEDLANALSKLDESTAHIRDNNAAAAVPTVAEAAQYLKNANMKISLLSIRDRIKILRENIENLKKEKGDEFAAEEIENALASLNEAEILLDQEKPAEAEEKISLAEKYFIAALGKTEQGLARTKIENTEALLARIKEKDKGNVFKNEREQAASLISEAKDLYTAESYRPSMEKAGDAEKILQTLSISIGTEPGTDNVIIDDTGTVTEYIVKLNPKDRDCLWKIAMRIYKDARLWPIIYVANKEQIKDPDLIFPGQRFKIPPPPKASAVQEPAPEHSGAAEPESTETPGAEGTPAM